MDKSLSRLTTKKDENREGNRVYSSKGSPSQNQLLEEFLTVEKRTSNFYEISSSPVFQSVSSPQIVLGLKRIIDNNDDEESMNENMKDVRGRNQKLADLFYNQKQREDCEDLTDSLDEAQRENREHSSCGLHYNFQNVSDVNQSFQVSPEAIALDGSSLQLYMSQQSATDSLQSSAKLRLKQNQQSQQKNAASDVQQKIIDQVEDIIESKPFQTHPIACVDKVERLLQGGLMATSSEEKNDPEDFIKWLQNNNNQTYQSIIAKHPKKQEANGQEKQPTIQPLVYPMTESLTDQNSQNSRYSLNPSVFQLNETTLRLRKTILEQIMPINRQVLSTQQPVIATVSTPEQGVQLTTTNNEVLQQDAVRTSPSSSTHFLTFRVTRSPTQPDLEAGTAGSQIITYPDFENVNSSQEEEPNQLQCLRIQMKSSCTDKDASKFQDCVDSLRSKSSLSSNNQRMNYMPHRAREETEENNQKVSSPEVAEECNNNEYGLTMREVQLKVEDVEEQVETYEDLADMDENFARSSGVSGQDNTQEQNYTQNNFNFEGTKNIEEDQAAKGFKVKVNDKEKQQTIVSLPHNVDMRSPVGLNSVFSGTRSNWSLIMAAKSMESEQYLGSRENTQNLCSNDNLKLPQAQDEEFSSQNVGRKSLEIFSPLNLDRATDFNVEKLDDESSFNKMSSATVTDQQSTARATGAPNSKNFNQNSSDRVDSFLKCESVPVEDEDDSESMDVADELAICTGRVTPQTKETQIQILIEDPQNSSLDHPRLQEYQERLSDRPSDGTETNGLSSYALPESSHMRSPTSNLTVEEIEVTVKSAGRLINEMNEGFMEALGEEGFDCYNNDIEEKRQQYLGTAGLQLQAALTQRTQGNCASDASYSQSQTEVNFCQTTEISGSSPIKPTEERSGSLIDLDTACGNMLSGEEKQAQLLQKFGPAEAISEEEEHMTYSSCTSPAPSGHRFSMVSTGPQQLTAASIHTDPSSKLYQSIENWRRTTAGSDGDHDGLIKIEIEQNQGNLSEQRTSERREKIKPSVQALQQLSASTPQESTKHKKFLSQAATLDRKSKRTNNRNKSNAVLVKSDKLSRSDLHTKNNHSAMQEQMKKQTPQLSYIDRTVASSVSLVLPFSDTTSSTTQDSTKSKTNQKQHLQRMSFPSPNTTPTAKPASSLGLSKAISKGHGIYSKTPSYLKQVPKTGTGSIQKTKSALTLSFKHYTSKLPQIGKKLLFKTSATGSIEILEQSSVTKNEACIKAVSRNHHNSSKTPQSNALKNRIPYSTKGPQIGKALAKTFELRKISSLSPVRSVPSFVSPALPKNQPSSTTSNKRAAPEEGNTAKGTNLKFSPPFRERQPTNTAYNSHMPNNKKQMLGLSYLLSPRTNQQVSIKRPNGSNNKSSQSSTLLSPPSRDGFMQLKHCPPIGKQMASSYKAQHQNTTLNSSTSVTKQKENNGLLAKFLPTAFHSSLNQSSQKQFKSRDVNVQGSVKPIQSTQQLRNSQQFTKSNISNTSTIKSLIRGSAWEPLPNGNNNKQRYSCSSAAI